MCGKGCEREVGPWQDGSLKKKYLFIFGWTRSSLLLKGFLQLQSQSGSLVAVASLVGEHAL